MELGLFFRAMLQTVKTEITVSETIVLNSPKPHSLKVT